MVKPLIGALLLCLTADVAAAQEYRGTILGRVFDQQGAVLPGATVQVINDKTNITDQTVTEADGAYSVSFLIPGAYTIKVELQGFKRFVQSGVTVAIGQRATVDVRLELGKRVERAHAELGPEEHGLQARDDRVAAEHRHEPGHTRCGHHCRPVAVSES